MHKDIHKRVGNFNFIGLRRVGLHHYLGQGIRIEQKRNVWRWNCTGNNPGMPAMDGIASTLPLALASIRRVTGLPVLLADAARMAVGTGGAAANRQAGHPRNGGMKHISEFLRQPELDDLPGEPCRKRLVPAGEIRQTTGRRKKGGSPK